jgi:hypothetical protein
MMEEERDNKRERGKEKAAMKKMTCHLLDLGSEWVRYSPFIT